MASSANSILLETGRPDDVNRFSYLFTEPVDVLQVNKISELDALFSQIEHSLNAGFYIAGYLAYECSYWFHNKAVWASETATDGPLAWIGVYRQPYIDDHIRTGFPLDAIKSPKVAHNFDLSSLGISDLRMEISRREYHKCVEAIRSYIAQGDSYQINFTTKVNFDFAGRPLDLYRALLARQAVPYSAFLNLGEHFVISSSPELFFRVDSGQIKACPMKGTARRGGNPEADEELRRWLQQDEKNRAENVMIVDLMRNDLGKICEIGSVTTPELFAIERYETLFQMTSTVTGRLRANLGWRDIFEAVFPGGSVTGAPKMRTMEIIRELESSPRGVYTGAIGFISPYGDAVFNIPIRTIVLRNGRGSMGVGSGITFDSVAKDEYNECLLKASFLTGMLQISN